MRILGIDPGSRITGFGVIDVIDDQQTRLIDAGTIEPKTSQPLLNRIDTIYQGLVTIINEHQPQIAVLEKLYAHHKYTTTAAIMGHARGVICLAIAQAKIEFIEYSVKRVRKALVGNGNANKEQTRITVAHVLKIKPNQLTLDASDALALALGHAAMLGHYDR